MYIINIKCFGVILFKIKIETYCTYIHICFMIGLLNYDI